MTSDPGKYTVSQGSFANITSAKASPSVRAQRGAAAFSSMVERDLGGSNDVEDTPGPGYYQPHHVGTGGDAASTPFRSRLKQRPAQPTGDAPPVGHYRLDSRWTSRAEVNSASPAFKSAVPRFGTVRRPTSPELGPGKYPVTTTHQRFRDAPKGLSFNTAGVRGARVEGTTAITPGPGTYDLFDKSSLPQAPSHWAASRVKRIPDPPASTMTSDPGKYTVSQGSFANITSAKASPSVRAQRGAAAFSSMVERDLGGSNDVEDTPGPGYYQPHHVGTGGDAASTPFRSRLKQRPAQPTGDAPPVGHYRLDSRWTSRAEVNSASPAFKSAVPRFGTVRRPTSPELGPGAYDPAIGEVAQERRARQHGLLGAESYPFSSSAARSCIDPRDAASRKQQAAQTGPGASTATSRARQRAARRG